MPRNTTKRFSVLVQIQLLEDFGQQLDLINENEKSSISRNMAIQAMMELLNDIPEKTLSRKADKFAVYDAAVKFGVKPVNVPDPPGCRCGDILKGIASPEECPLFGETCTPLKPVGPCMVSSEGSCAAHYHYG
jgi:hydrogenase maturation factor